MSIYATLGCLKLPVSGWPAGDEDWIEIHIQGVPGHIGHPGEYPEGDLYSFLPPVVDDPDALRAVVFVDDLSSKERQEYINPILVLSGAEYRAMPWPDLWEKLQTALQDRWLDKRNCVACGATLRTWRTWKNVRCRCGAMQPWSVAEGTRSARWLA
jgi:hypothetical protein